MSEYLSTISIYTLLLKANNVAEIVSEISEHETK